MIKHFLKITLRLFFKRKLYGLVSLFGLVIAFSVSFIILIYTINEFRINKGYKNHDRMYRVINHDHSTDIRNAHMTRDFKEIIKNSIPELEGVTRIAGSKSNIKAGEASFPVSVMYVDTDFFKMFADQKGIDSTLLPEDSYKVVISQEVADRYFKDISTREAGFTMMFYGKELEVGIDQVFPGFDENSTLQADVICLMDLYLKNFDNPLLEWHPWFDTFVMLYDHVGSGTIKKKLDEVDESHFDGISASEFYLQPFDDFYLGSSNIGSHYFPVGDKTMLRWLGLTAFLLMVISIVNHGILSTANSLTRLKEYGVRKTFGSNKSNIRIQSISESVFMTLIAFPISIILTEMILPLTNRFFGMEYDFHFLDNWILSLIFLGIIILTGVVSGSYLAFYISRLKPALIMTPGVNKVRGSGISKYLLTAQVFIFITLVAFVLLVLKQINYFNNKDLGYQAQNLVEIRLQKHHVDPSNLFDASQHARVESFVEELLQFPDIINASFVIQMLPFLDHSGLMSVDLKTETGGKHTLLAFSGGPGMLETIGCELIEGRLPLKSSQDEILLNETAAALLEKDNPVGAMVNSKYTVVGIVRDFHMQSFRMKINPLYIQYNENMNGPYFSIIFRHNSEDVPVLIERCKEISKNLFPDFDVNIHFQEDKIKTLYQKESKIFQTIGLATILILIISCTGMFALCLYESERKTKEIGIRKINGASTGDILTLLSGSFLKWVFLAFLLACPFAYFIMKKWLEGFVYDTPITWWLFALAGASAITISLITISYQTYKAARKNPIEVIRYE
jgi:putative ABC transport system permease protein